MKLLQLKGFVRTRFDIEINVGRRQANLLTAIRLFVLYHYRGKSAVGSGVDAARQHARALSSAVDCVVPQRCLRARGLIVYIHWYISIAVKS
jgi:hypothetical protein